MSTRHRRAHGFPCPVIAALVMGCLLSSCIGTPPSAGRPAGGASVKPRASSRPLADDALGARLRIIERGVARELTGKVKLISDQGGSIVSDHGGALVSAESGRIVSNNGGSMIGKTKFFRLADHGGLPEDLLADAVVEVLDAAGQALAGPDGKPFRATSDKDGRYVLKATLPPENVVLRVRLDPALGGAGGELQALVASKATVGPLPVDLDTASSLGAAYVLSEYVKGAQSVLDRLPAEANEDLRRSTEFARAQYFGRPSSYAPAELAGQLAALRRRDGALDETLKQVEAILLAGQRDLGAGLQATSVALSLPVGVVAGADGSFFVAEGVAGRIRRIGPDGTVTIFAGDALDGRVADGVAGRAATFELIDDLVSDPAGGMYLVERGAHRVVHLDPEGTLRVVAGTGAPGQGPDGVPAREAPLKAPTSAAVGPDGTLYIAEAAQGKEAPRLLAVTSEGTLRALQPPPTNGSPDYTGVAVTADGALWVAMAGHNAVWRRDPGGAWALVSAPLNLGYYGRLLAAPDRGVYVTENGGDRLLHLAPSGAVTLLAGLGQPGAPRPPGAGGTIEEQERRLSRPMGMALRPDGKLLVVDAGQLVVRQVDPAEPAKLTVVAGAVGIVQVGPSESLAVNGPAGLTIAPDGRLVFAELGGHAVKSLADGRVELVAGGRTGAVAEGGLARDAALVAPSSVAYDRAGNLWILESTRPRLLRVNPAGTIETVAGNGRSPFFGVAGAVHAEARTAGRSLQMGRPVALAIGPDDRPYWVDQGFNLVFRLAPDGFAEVVVGSLPAKFEVGADAGDGGPASEARLNFPAGLAFDGKGDMYIGDTLNFRVRRVSMGEATRPIETVAGLPQAETFAALLAEGGFRPEEGGAAAAQPLLGPGPLCFDGRGRLYVAEGGTARLRSLIGGNGLDLPPVLPRVPSRVRRIDLEDARRPMVTIAGQGGRVLTAATGDDSPGLPIGLVLDRQGRLVLADGLYNQIKLIPAASLD